MRFAVPLLFVILQLIESTVGSCRFRAIVDEKQAEPVHQTRLQLECDNVNCLTTNFTIHTDLNISPDCVDSECSKLFNLCEDSCIIDGQEPPAAQEAPICSQTTIALGSVTRTPVNACPTVISCTPSTTVLTITKTQSLCNTTSIILPTTTKIQEIPTTVTLITTTTTWTPCPQSTMELAATAVTKRPFHKSCNNFTFTITHKSCDSFTSTLTTTALSSVKSPCTPKLPQFTTRPAKSNSVLSSIKSSKLPQFTTQPAKSNSSTASLDLRACSCSEPGTCTQRVGSSNATSTLGALLGICMVMLTLVTAGWVWTCWKVRKRGGITVNSKLNNFPNTPGTVTINNNTDTLRRLQNPVYEETALNGLLPSEVDPQTGHGDNSEETGPTYEIIPLPAIVNKKASKENGNIPREKDGEETAGGGVSGGVATSINDDTRDNIGSVGGDKMNIYFLSDERTKEECSETTRDTDQENNYHLLSNAEETKKEGVRESVYHILKSPLDDVDEDYADPDEDEMNNIYHVLEGPTPEREEERERDEAEGEEPLTEPTAYEVPVTSSSKHNSIVQ